MDKLKLVEIFNVEERGKVRVRLQYDERSSELYVNDRKVVTEVSLTCLQKLLAYSVSTAIKKLR